MLLFDLLKEVSFSYCNIAICIAEDRVEGLRMYEKGQYVLFEDWDYFFETKKIFSNITDAVMEDVERSDNRLHWGIDEYVSRKYGYTKGDLLYFEVMCVQVVINYDFVEPRILCDFCGGYTQIYDEVINKKESSLGLMPYTILIILQKEEDKDFYIWETMWHQITEKSTPEEAALRTENVRTRNLMIDLIRWDDITRLRNLLYNKQSNTYFNCGYDNSELINIAFSIIRDEENEHVPLDSERPLKHLRADIENGKADKLLKIDVRLAAVYKLLGRLFDMYDDDLTIRLFSKTYKVIEKYVFFQ